MKTGKKIGRPRKALTPEDIETAVRMAKKAMPTLVLTQLPAFVLCSDCRCCLHNPQAPGMFCLRHPPVYVNSEHSVYPRVYWTELAGCFDGVPE
jgi:hypothetical protein